MQDSRRFGNTENQGVVVIVPHPFHLFVIAEVEDALDYVYSVFFGVNRLRVNVPKKRLPKLNLRWFLPRFHTRIITYFTQNFSAFPAIHLVKFAFQRESTIWVLGVNH